jgi:GTP-binding protein
MKFVDEATIHVQAGDGGRGMVSFRREPFVPRGGPNGGDGGHGGSVVLLADPQLHTLVDYKFQQHHKAERGGHGGGNDRSGKNGEDRVLRVPVGTLVKSEEGELLADLAEPGARYIAARGGRGGRGNKSFATAVRQAPDFAEPGERGEAGTVCLELKLLADVGLVGFPNVGKSTLISRVSAARPKIAAYPFTTLTPHLGVVSAGPERSFVVADIPGLIPGAHAGAGLGDRFLRHVERTRLLLHLVTVTHEEGRDPLRDFDVLEAELRLFNPELAERPKLVALTMMDLPFVAEQEAEIRARFAERGLELFAISAVTGAGVKELVYALADRVLAPA